MEDTQLSSNRRIAKNTLLLYARMFIMMAISLYTSRVVLDKLGVVDFGIYNVVGGIVGMLGFLNGTMANTVQRFLSFAMGQRDSDGVHRVFCVSVVVHAFIALFVLVVLEIAGVWYLGNYLNVPPSRLDAAYWVLQCSIVTTLFSIMQVPYNGIIIAKEQMGIYAYISILEAALKLAVVFLLAATTFDRLKFYSVLMMLVTVGILLIYRLYCIRKYREARFHFTNDRPLMRKMLSFAGWNMTSEVAWAFTGPGVNIILNWFFGPIVNAAMGIATQVNGAVSRFVQNFQVAVNPQIIKLYSAGEAEKMEQLVFRGTRFSFYLLLALSLPLILQMDYVLGLWLKEVPAQAAVFCQLVLLCSLTSIVSNLLPKVAWATGRIKNYQIIVSCILVLNFPLSYIVLKMGAPAWAAVVVNIGIQAVLIFVRLGLTANLTGRKSVVPFLKKVLCVCLAVGAVASAIPLGVAKICPTRTFAMFCINTAVCLACTAASAYFIGMDRQERAAAADYAKRFIHKFRA